MAFKRSAVQLRLSPHENWSFNMFNMTQIREKSSIVLWLFLIIFILSMVAGGLLGGANIVDLIFGGTDPSRYAGWVDDRGISHREFQNQYNNQLSAFQQQNRPIDGRTSQTASNTAWNIIVDNEFKNKKVKELGLAAQQTEIYEFLFYTPPPSFQNMFIAAGMFVDDENKFVLEDYQQAVESGDLPEEFNAAFARWESYLKNWLGNRKLQNLYSKASTLSNQEIQFEYMKNNINCNIDYIFINTNKISNNDIDISDEDIQNHYNENKEENYTTPETRTINYVSWAIPNEIKLDTLNYTSYIDSLKDQALLFADEADITSFNKAVEELEYKSESLQIHEGFNSNSGFPFQMGTSRLAVRFIFDNDFGSISDPIQMDNQIIVLTILDEEPAGYKPLEDVENSIKSILIREKKKTYALELFESKLESSDDWSALSKQDTLFTFVSNESGTIGGSFKDIGKSNEITGALLALEEGETSNALTTYNTICKIKINSKDMFDEAAYNESYNEIKKQLVATKNRSNYQSWLNHMKDNSTVNDFRSKMY
tara:strand:+ start:1779 stop:3398 length:1620 start_codon:yes stop_codon:yes gene_type:complete